MSEEPNIKLLVLARELRGLDQLELAGKIGVSPSKLCKIESGALRVSVDDLKALAAALRFPVEFFFKDSPRRAQDSGCFYHRKRQSLSAKSLRRIHANLDALQMQVEELLSGVVLDGTISGFGPIDPDEFEGNVQAVARMVRSRWRLRPGPIENLTHEIERCGGIVIPCNFGTDKLFAISQISSPLPALFYVNSEIQAEGVRMNLAHEVGHLIMHNGPTPLQDVEAEANQFAAEFLMPEEDIRAEFPNPVTLQGLVPLKLKWKVSLQALIHRAQDLSVITESQTRWLYIQVSKRGWKKREPYSIVPEQPTVLRDVLDLYRKNLGQSIAEMAKRTGWLEDEFARQFFPGETKPRLLG